MVRALVSLTAFWLSWALFLAWLSNHRIAPRGRYGTHMPDLTALEALIIPALIWLAASCWSFYLSPAYQPPLSRLRLIWRTLLLGLCMFAGAIAIWLFLLIVG